MEEEEQGRKGEEEEALGCNKMVFLPRLYNNPKKYYMTNTIIVLPLLLYYRFLPHPL